MFNRTISDIAEKVIHKEGAVSFEEARELVALSEDHFMDLIACAGKIRSEFKKNKVFTCSIINAKSGFCSQDCAFCAQSSFHKTGIKTYPLLSEQELVENAILMDKAGATHYSFVTSGYKLSEKEIAGICNTAREIRQKTDLSICCSLGMLTESTAKQLFESGITRYHHNLETARSYFDRICTTHGYDEDIETIGIARSAGFEVCSGGILGMGETWEQRLELAFTLKELSDSIPINFLNPIPGTKLENRPLLPPVEALTCIAVFRFINPEKDITIAGGREVTLKDFQSWVFMAGANGLMVGNYLTTAGRNSDADMEMIRELGLVKLRKWPQR